MGLREEIRSDPACAEALAARDCQEMARIRSIGRPPRAALAQIADVQAALQTSGAWWAIKAAAADQAHPANAAAVAVMDVGAARYSNLDTSLPLVGQMFGALVVTDVIPQEQMDAVLALGFMPDPLTAHQVGEALYNADGSDK